MDLYIRPSEKYPSRLVSNGDCGLFLRGLQPPPTQHDRPITATLWAAKSMTSLRPIAGSAAAQQSEPCSLRAELAAIGLAFLWTYRQCPESDCSGARWVEPEHTLGRRSTPQTGINIRWTV